MRHIRNVDPKPPLFEAIAPQENRVVKILRVVRVNGHDAMRAAIHAPRQFRGQRLALRTRFGQGGGLLQHFLGEMKREVVLAQNGKHINSLLIGRAKNLDDFAFGIGVARFPDMQFHHHLVPDAGRTARVARRRHVDVMRDARIVGNDKEELFATLQGADDGGARALQDAPHRAGGFGRLAAAGDLAPHQHPVSIEGGAGGVFGHDDFSLRQIIRFQKALALAVDAEAARHKVRHARLDVAIALGAEDLPVLFQVAQGLLQRLLLVGTQPQRLQQLRDIGRNVVVAGQATQD